MGRIDKKEEIMIIYGNKSKYGMNNLKIMGLDYWELKYRYYRIKKELDFGILVKKELLKNKPKLEVLKVFDFLYLITK